MKKTLSLVVEFALILMLVVLSLTLAAMDLSVDSNPLGIFRLFLGLLVVILLPGYGLIGALFPRTQATSGVVRLALSVSLSLAVIPLLALLLDRLPWGIRFWPVMVSEALLIVLFSLLSWYRRAGLPRDQRFQLSFEFGMRPWWAAQDRINRVVYIFLLGVLVVAMASAAAILLIPQPGRYYTEFYILGPEGMAQYYPREAVVGESVDVTLGITNLERADHQYRVDLWVQDSAQPDRRLLVKQIDPFQLPQGQNFEYPLNWVMPWVGDDQQIEFLLFIDQDPQPYRQLRLWLDVIELKN